jgi:hypothetical protein
MMNRFLCLIVPPLLVVSSGATEPSGTSGRSANPSSATAPLPLACAAEHNIGNMRLGVDNFGMFGTSYYTSGVDYFTGNKVSACQFPKGATPYYLWGGALWVGGIAGGDTLVSVAMDGWAGGHEMNPDIAPFGAMSYRSTISGEMPLRIGAVSHQDFQATYFDTCVRCPAMLIDLIDKRPHKPLGIRVEQKTYAWQYPHAENAVIITYVITNFKTQSIHDAYVGVYVDADVYLSGSYTGYGDDVSGFLNTISLTSACSLSARLPIAWTADNEGDCDAFRINIPHVTGTAVLTPPSGDQRVAFNWWSPWVYQGPSDFGPMRKCNTRTFVSGGTGLPLGDRDKYFVLSNGDVDYDQPFAGSISPLDTQWIYPGYDGTFFAQGSETKYLLSIGPFDLFPGQQIPFAFAYVGGYNLHRTYDNQTNLPDHPDVYERWLDFSDLKRNALNAAWIYDNPGVDTDSDGYSGKYELCGDDTVWYEGDGVPDLRADWPPPAPTITITPTIDGALIRWNGAIAEQRVNWFSKMRDFEGYRVYLRRVDSAVWDSVAAFDIENYLRVHWDTTMQRWECHEYPYTIDSLRCRYAPGGCADQSWQPLRYSTLSPFSPPSFSDSLFYFAPVGCNASRLGHDTRINKAYPGLAPPKYSSPADVPVDSVDFYLTPEGNFKYYEYEVLIDNLNPADSYFVAVTALSNGRASLDGHNPLSSSIDAANRQFTPLLPTNCCFGMTGNVDCSPNGSVDITDLTTLIDHMFINMSPLCCIAEANIDGDSEGRVDIADLTRLIDFLFVSFAPMTACE